jgi:serine/threonine protein kinase
MELLSELNKLAIIKHTNSLPILGFACQSSPDAEFIVVTPYMARGSLYDALHGNYRERHLRTLCELAEIKLDAAWRVSFLLGVARGIQALHAANVVHGNLNSKNMLIGEDGSALLSDAGSPLKYENPDMDMVEFCFDFHGMYDPYRAVRTMGTGDEFTCKGDIFSFGVVILEMLTGRQAYYERPGRAYCETDPCPSMLKERFRSIRPDDLDDRIHEVVTEASACCSGFKANSTAALASFALQATSSTNDHTHSREALRIRNPRRLRYSSMPSIDVALDALDKLQGSVYVG